MEFYDAAFFCREGGLSAHIRVDKSRSYSTTLSIISSSGHSHPSVIFFFSNLQQLKTFSDSLVSELREMEGVENE